MPKFSASVLPFTLILVTIGQFGIDLYLPSLPAISKYFWAEPNWAQLTLTLYLLGFGSSALAYGTLSDALGRKRVLLGSLSIFLLSTLLCIYAPNIEMLVLARLLQGIGAGGSAGLSWAMVRDCYGGTRLAKISSYLSLVWSVTPVIAPALGGYVEVFWGWKANFWAMFIYVGLAWILFALFLPETLAPKNRTSLNLRTSMSSFRALFRNHTYMLTLVLCTLSFSVTIAFSVVGPFLFQDYLGLSADEFGLLVLAIAIGYLIACAINSKMVGRVSSLALIYGGVWTLILASVVMVAMSSIGAYSIWSLAAILLVANATGGLIYPNAQALGIGKISENIGAASALSGFLTLTGVTVTSALVALLPESGPLPVSWVFLGLGLLMLLTLRFLKKG